MSDDGFRRLVAERGITARPLYDLLTALAGGATFDELVRSTALPRRAVEAALEALGDAVTSSGDTRRLTAGAREAYADLLAPQAPSAPPAGDDLPAGLVARVEAAVAAAPAAKRDLDHVAATAETVARRAVYLARTYALAGRRVLCVGDHDLTSLAVAAVEPTAEVAVADMDEDVLAHIAATASAHGSRVTCAFADFRVGLPRRLRNWADLVVTDPPYTPEGVALFARRGLEALADHGTGRLVVAYGYGDQPGLGLKVQEALAELRLAYEAVLPAFNRYVGAQAIGSASNLYVLRATAATRRQVARPDRPGTTNVYTHGTQSLEGGDDPLTPAEASAIVALAERPTVTRPSPSPSPSPLASPSAAVAAAAPSPSGTPDAPAAVVRSSGATRPTEPAGPTRSAGPAEATRSSRTTAATGAAPAARSGRHGGGAAAPVRVGLAVGAGWPDGTVRVPAGTTPTGPATATLAACLVPDTPEASPCRGRNDAVVADLRHDAGPLLLRLLLAIEAPRAAIVVRNDHPDVADQAGQEALATLVAPKFALRYARSTPSPTLAVVEATTVPPPTAAPERARRGLLDRPHGKLANAAREALIRASTATRTTPLTKNEARALVAEHLSSHDLTGPLLDLPRTAIPPLLASLTTAAEAATTS